MQRFYEELSREIKELKENSLFREHVIIESKATTPWIYVNNQKLLNLASNNYLGLADSKLLVERSIEMLKKYGASAASSRMVCGTLKLHVEVEKSLAEFQKKESAVLFNTGYSANLGVIQALVSRDDVIFSDKLNHASIIDGAVLSRAALKRYRHCDMNHLEHLLKTTNTKGRKLIITDSVFSMDGDLASLKDLVYLKQKYGAILMLDEAHAEGVFGESGRGLAEHFGAEEEVDIHLGTLGKAFGCFGAYVCGKRVLIDYLKNKCRSFIYTTALPPAVLGSILAALEIIRGEKGKSLRQSLHAKSNAVRKKLKEMGFDTLGSQSQIIPIVIPGNENVCEFSKKLLDSGVLAVAIRHPTVPKNTERVRISLMATHKDEDLEFALRKISTIGSHLRGEEQGFCVKKSDIYMRLGLSSINLA